MAARVLHQLDALCRKNFSTLASISMLAMFLFAQLPVFFMVLILANLAPTQLPPQLSSSSASVTSQCRISLMQAELSTRDAFTLPGMKSSTLADQHRVCIINDDATASTAELLSRNLVQCGLKTPHLQQADPVSDHCDAAIYLSELSNNSNKLHYHIWRSFDPVLLQLSLDDMVIDAAVSSNAGGTRFAPSTLQIPGRSMLNEVFGVFNISALSAFFMLLALITSGWSGLVQPYLMKEKVSNARAAFSVVGVGHLTLLLAWILPLFALILVASIAFALAMTPILPVHFSHIVILCFLTANFSLLSVWTVTLSYFVTALTDSEKISNAIANYLPLLVAYISFHFPGNILVLLLSPFQSFANALNILLAASTYVRSQETVLAFSVVGTPLIAATLHSVLACIALACLAAYANSVLPSKHSVPKKWDFFWKEWLQPRVRKQLNHLEHDDEATALLLARATNRHRFERLGKHDINNVGIRLQNIHKTFDGGRHVAVDNVSLDLVRGQVFGLLGHNGAGKTTLLRCITGQTQASGGEIAFDSAARESTLGMCPQHNVLLDRLTVRQHLMLFARLHGLDRQKAASEARLMMQRLELEHKADTCAQHLSGGQKRSLCVGIAFSGAAQFVVLDEPSSGMDVEAQRRLWKMIKSFKRDRIIVITTHSLEEADVLSDRIGIMCEGQLRCLGSPLFLKNTCGAGYGLSVTVAPDRFEKVRSDVVAVVPDAKLLSFASSEARFRLPHSSRLLFPALFDALDTNAVPYGIAQSTLEDVFFTVGDGASTSARSRASKIPINIRYDENCSKVEQFRVMLTILWTFARGDVAYWIFSIGWALYALLRSSKRALAILSFVWNGGRSLGVGPGILNSRPLGEFLTNCPIETLPSGNGVSYRFEPSETVLGVAMLNPSIEYVLLCSREPDTDRVLEQVMGRDFASASRARAALELLVPNDANSRFSAIVQGGSSFDNHDTSAQRPDFNGNLLGFTLASVAAAVLVHLRSSQLQLQLLVAGVDLGAYWAAAVFIISLQSVVPLLLCTFVTQGVFAMPPAEQLLLTLACVSFATFWSSFMVGSGGRMPARMLFFISVCYMGSTLCMFIVQALSSFTHPIVGTAFERLVMIVRLLVPPVTIADKDISSRGMILMFQTVLYLVLGFLIDLIRLNPGAIQRLQQLLCFFKSVSGYPSGSVPDDDVLVELRRVHNCESDLVRVLAFSKTFSDGTTAVEEVSFGVSPGSAFAFLGTNGAGKTTTIRALIADEVPTLGCLYINGVDVVQQPMKARRQLGYCSQFDTALIDSLSARQHLHLFARLHGAPARSRHHLVDSFLSAFELTAQADRAAGTFSGGNKRKLSTALATLGSRPVVLLDEPSAGVDPAARRRIWQVLESIPSKEQQRCMMLTTHSLEEAEALCSRISIMARGRLRCLGSCAHLRRKFGDCLQIQVSATTVPHANAFVANMTRRIPEAKLLEIFGTRMTFSLKKNAGYSLATLFAMLEKAKEADSGLISEYGIADTPLDTIFMAMADEEENSDASPHVIYMEG